MLTEKLDPYDLNSETKRNNFEGMFVYAQTKVANRTSIEKCVFLWPAEPSR